MAGLGRKCWQIQHYFMGSQAGIIKNTANIVQVLRIHTFNTLLSFGSEYIFSFLFLYQKTEGASLMAQMNLQVKDLPALWEIWV